MKRDNSLVNREINNVVITGPTGAIGHALCSLLLRENKKVYAVVRPKSCRASTLPEGVDIIECDISDYAMLPDRISHADAFVHLAWASSDTPCFSKTGMVWQNCVQGI